MKTLALVSTGYGRPPMDELRALERADRYPRASLFSDLLGADLLDERALAQLPLLRRAAYRVLPEPFPQVLEGYLARGRYDAVISWAERLALPFAALLRATGSTMPHVAIVSWISKPKKARVLRRVHSHIDRLVTGSSVQRDFAVRELGIPGQKVVHLKLFVDEQFFRPLDREPDTICAVGREMRDYPTLIEAMRGLSGLRCHIAAGAHRGKVEGWVRAIDDSGALPPGMTVGKLDYPDLRELYARSHFVVIPLLETDTDNGVTAILEAMAMGKAVICTRTRGQVDVIQDGVNGLLVPQGDPGALRRAIERLRRDPAEAQRLGRAGRETVEEQHTIGGYMSELRKIVEDAIEERREARAPRGATSRSALPDAGAVPTSPGARRGRG